MRRCSREYPAHSEKLTARLPFVTPYAMSQEAGATCVYEGQTVALE